MTGEQFEAWRRNLGLTQEGAAEVLELSLNTVQAYEAGELPIPKVVELACRALQEARS